MNRLQYGRKEQFTVLIACNSAALNHRATTVTLGNGPRFFELLIPPVIKTGSTFRRDILMDSIITSCKCILVFTGTAAYCCETD